MSKFLYAFCVITFSISSLYAGDQIPFPRDLERQITTRCNGKDKYLKEWLEHLVKEKQDVEVVKQMRFALNTFTESFFKAENEKSRAVSRFIFRTHEQKEALNLLYVLHLYFKGAFPFVNVDYLYFKLDDISAAFYQKTKDVDDDLVQAFLNLIPGESTNWLRAFEFVLKSEWCLEDLIARFKALETCHDFVRASLVATPHSLKDLQLFVKQINSKSDELFGEGVDFETVHKMISALIERHLKNEAFDERLGVVANIAEKLEAAYPCLKKEHYDILLALDALSIATDELEAYVEGHSLLHRWLKTFGDEIKHGAFIEAFAFMLTLEGTDDSEAILKANPGSVSVVLKIKTLFEVTDDARKRQKALWVLLHVFRDRLGELFLWSSSNFLTKLVAFEGDIVEGSLQRLCAELFPESISEDRRAEALEAILDSKHSFSDVHARLKALEAATSETRQDQAYTDIYHDILFVLAVQNCSLDDLKPLAKILTVKAKILFNDIVSQGMVVGVARAMWGLLPIVDNRDLHPKAKFKNVHKLVTHFASKRHDCPDLEERIDAVMKTAREFMSTRYSFSDVYELIISIDNLDLETDAIAAQMKAFAEKVNSLKYTLDLHSNHALQASQYASLINSFLRCGKTGQAFDAHIQKTLSATEALSQFPHLGDGGNAYERIRDVKSQIFKVLLFAPWAHEAVEELIPYQDKLFALDFEYFYPCVTFFFDTAIGHVKDLEEAKAYFDVFFKYAESCKEKINFEHIKNECTKVEALEAYLKELCG